MREILKDRERALEYEFFHRVDKRLLKELREKIELEAQEKALGDATGIVDDAVLAELVEVNITPQNDLRPVTIPAGVDCLGGRQRQEEVESNAVFRLLKLLEAFSDFTRCLARRRPFSLRWSRHLQPYKPPAARIVFFAGM